MRVNSSADASMHLPLSVAPEALVQCPGNQHQEALARLCSGPLVVYNRVYLQDEIIPCLLP